MHIFTPIYPDSHQNKAINISDFYINENFLLYIKCIHIKKNIKFYNTQQLKEEI